MQPATNSQQAMSNLQAYQQGLQTPDQQLSSEQNTLGVGQAQQQVSGLRQAINNTTNLLNQVAPSVQGRTQNSLVTSAQAGKLISNEEAPIQQNLAKNTSDYNDANQNYTQLEQQAEARANADLSSQNTQMSYLQNIYNDLYGKETASQAAATQAQQFQADLSEKQREANLSAGASDPTSAILSAILGNQGRATAAQPVTGGISLATLEAIFGKTPAPAKAAPKGPSTIQKLEQPFKSVGNFIKNGINI